MGAMVLLLWGCVTSLPAVTLAGPALVYIFIYSFLPHKELRFIVYTFPVLNAAAAFAAAAVWRNRSKSFFRGLMAVGLVGLLALNVVGTSVFLYVSHLNYPGGQAMTALHTLEQNQNDVNVHIDVYTAQTGVSRFTQLRDTWSYNKTEDLVAGGADMASFTHIMLGALSEKRSELAPYISSHTILHSIPSFTGFGVSWKTFPFLHIKTKETLWILKKIADRS